MNSEQSAAAAAALRYVVSTTMQGSRWLQKNTTVFVLSVIASCSREVLTVVAVKFKTSSRLATFCCPLAYCFPRRRRRCL